MGFVFCTMGRVQRVPLSIGVLTVLRSGVLRGSALSHLGAEPWSQSLCLALP